MKIACKIACLILLLNFNLAAKNILTIHEPFNKIPVLLNIDKEKVYILDIVESVVHVFSLDNAEHYTICKRGEGPGESKFITKLTNWKNKIVLSGSQKLLYYDIDGRYLNEKKVPYGRGSIIPFGDKFICKDFDNSPEKTIISATLYDSDFSSPRKLEEYIIDRAYRGENGKVNEYIFKDFFGYEATSQYVIVGNTQKGFYFGIYEKTGKKIRTINLDYKKIAVTAERKKDFHSRLKNQVGLALFKRLMKKYNQIFPDYYPAYEYFTVADNKIYIRLYPATNGLQKLLTLDFNGKTLSRNEVPTIGPDHTFLIRDSNYYYIKENPGRETWELHTKKLLTVLNKKEEEYNEIQEI